MLEHDMTSRLSDAAEAEACHSPGDTLAINIPGQLQADMTSSRTKRSLIMAGRSGSSK
jgi:hypothetical protein